jgi:SAM-dependent methyltransferase
MMAFFVGLGLTCASTLMYEIVLTRLLSVLCWYYLAFVAVSMAMFGMTAGALAVQLRPDFFPESKLKLRMTQASVAMAASMPLALMTMLAVPVQLSLAVETFYSFLLFSSIIAVPFFFSGVVVCLSLTKTPFPVGRVYAADLLGASAGCLGSVLLLKIVDAPSAVLVISSMLFLSAAAYARYAGEDRLKKNCFLGAVGVVLLAGLNAATLYGIQPIWSKGQVDDRRNILYEVWNPISKVRVHLPEYGEPDLVSPPAGVAPVSSELINLDIDNGAATQINYFYGDLKTVDYLRYSVTSFGPQIRAGGSAAIIGVGGGRDVLNCAVHGFHRIVGIELNGAIVDLTSRRLASFSGFDKIPGFELHTDEARSYLTRSQEKFDLIQASMVDTFAATSAGSMTLTENSLYTVDAWRVFYQHLKPGGVISFTRWYLPPGLTESYRLFAVAYAMLLSEGVADPASHLIVIAGQVRATLMASNQPFTDADLLSIQKTSRELGYQLLIFPGAQPAAPEFATILHARTLSDLANLQTVDHLDYSPVYDSSPYFFNPVRLSRVPAILRESRVNKILEPVISLFGYMAAALVLVLLTIILPTRRWASRQADRVTPPVGGVIYFVAIGLGFMLVEMAMMQQLSIFLGHPIYSLVVVLAGLILATGMGSLLSDRLHVGSRWASRWPALLTAVAIFVAAALIIPAIHRFVAGQLWERVAVSLSLLGPCGLLMGLCFPVGLRRVSQLNQKTNLPWMWAVNGAASVLASFLAILVSMETSILDCLLAGAVCYALAGIFL